MSSRTRIERPARMEHLRELVDTVVRAAGDAGAPESVRHDVRLAVEEACTNVIVHGYGSQAVGPITVTATVEHDEIIVQIVDRAPPFAPDDAPQPPVDESWQTRRAGGLGWHLIRSVMDRVEYRRAEPDTNILTLTKRLERASDGDAAP
jgi:serine/threonine-protein kinase RsbW